MRIFWQASHGSTPTMRHSPLIWLAPLKSSRNSWPWPSAWITTSSPSNLRGPWWRRAASSASPSPRRHHRHRGPGRIAPRLCSPHLVGEMLSHAAAGCVDPSVSPVAVRGRGPGRRLAVTTVTDFADPRPGPRSGARFGSDGLAPRCGVTAGGCPTRTGPPCHGPGLPASTAGGE